jgi:hypothetical protein
MSRAERIADIRLRIPYWIRREECRTSAVLVLDMLVSHSIFVARRQHTDHEIGGPTAAVVAYQNPHLKVTVVDRDPVRIAQWNSKHIPLYEPGLQYVSLFPFSLPLCLLSYHPSPVPMSTH